MENDCGQPPLARRVPGANLRPRAMPPPSPPVLPDAVVQQVQAAVEAERAAHDEPTASASPLQSDIAEATDSGRNTRRLPRPASRSAKRKRGSQPMR